ncbi:MAG TPA: hypothetical protein VN258_15120 [Mobilitalea sp.]|nr:hypothetical protein [Mobilitalea sp.]
MGYFYKIYGLMVRSEIELPEAYVIEEQAEYDVEIIYGVMPEQMKEKKREQVVISTLLREYKWFYFDKEGYFFIENGSKITVEPDDTADSKHIRSLVLGACFGSIMYQREIISIHGSAVVWKDKVIIISGNSGAGKSTVSAEFRKRGCLFLADDTVAVTIEDGIIYANPAYPQQKLCTDAARELGYNLNDLELLQEEREKYAVLLDASYCRDKKEIAAMICLDVHKEEHLLIKEITSGIKLEYIIANLYTSYDFKYIGMNPQVFKKCLEVAQKVPLIRAIRPENKNVAAQIVEEIIGLVDKSISVAC